MTPSRRPCSTRPSHGRQWRKPVRIRRGPATVTGERSSLGVRRLGGEATGLPPRYGGKAEGSTDPGAMPDDDAAPAPYLPAVGRSGAITVAVSADGNPRRAATLQRRARGTRPRRSRRGTPERRRPVCLRTRPGRSGRLPRRPRPGRGAAWCDQRYLGARRRRQPGDPPRDELGIHRRVWTCRTSLTSEATRSGAVSPGCRDGSDDTGDPGAADDHRPQYAHHDCRPRVPPTAEGSANGRRVTLEHSVGMENKVRLGWDDPALAEVRVRLRGSPPRRVLPVYSGERAGCVPVALGD
jgi:hypothetical protein